MISGNKIGDVGVEKIAEALKVSQTLTSIDLAGDDLISLFCFLMCDLSCTLLFDNVLVCE